MKTKTEKLTKTQERNLVNKLSSEISKEVHEKIKSIPQKHLRGEVHAQVVIRTTAILIDMQPNKRIALLEIMSEVLDFVKSVNTGEFDPECDCSNCVKKKKEAQSKKSCK